MTMGYQGMVKVRCSVREGYVWEEECVGLVKKAPLGVHQAGTKKTPNDVLSPCAPPSGAEDSPSLHCRNIYISNREGIVSHTNHVLLLYGSIQEAGTYRSW